MIEEIKTATHKGNTYQIGKVYAFSDYGEEWEHDILKEFQEDSRHPCHGESENWNLIRAIEPSGLGTITPAPIELIDGGAYMFNSHNTKLLDAIGLYEENNNRFYFNGSYADLAYCSFIRLMSVESK